MNEAIITLLISLSALSCHKDIPCVYINDTCFNVEIADTPEEITYGLMFRDSLKEDCGMLFVFPHQGKYPLWMKHTKLELDILWINKDKKIVHIKKNAKPCMDKDYCPSINPGVDASYVLEINAGLCDQFAIHEGDTVQFAFD